MAIREDISEYVELKIRQVKFELIELLAEKRARAIIAGIFVLLSLLLLLFTSLFTSLLLNHYLNSTYWGFGITALFWLVLFLLLLLFRKSIQRSLFIKYLNQHIPD
jgi:hypothetical protein